MQRNFGLILFNFILVISLLGLPATGKANVAPGMPDAPAGTGLQFNGTSQYVTLGVPNGFTINNPTWPAAKWGTGLQFNGTNQYATFGRTARLGLQTFTLETWFYWTGGSGASTGTGGLTSAIPLLTKGRGEGDATNVDMNYFLGINIATSTLAADFEEGLGQPSPGLNHPVIASTPITQNTWHHAAATFDGQTWNLYLDGNLDGTLNLGQVRYPRWDSIQHAGLATALTSAGVASGYFGGMLDEARIWNYVRSAPEIQASMDVELPSAAGLVGRWGMNEASGAFVADSSTPNTLGVSSFTLEAWVYWTGGVGTSTGTGGLTSAIPLVTRGRGEAENSNLDMNYFLGIDTITNRLAADFEEGAGQPSPGLNHPGYATTALTQNAWHHVAVTYDGRYWSFYLDGAPDGVVDVGSIRLPRSDSIQHAGLASALNSNGTPAGYFAGKLDEVRVWNTVRTSQEILDNYQSELASATNLVGRWGMNESSGWQIGDSSGGNLYGDLYASPAWVDGFPLPDATPPAAPVNLAAVPGGEIVVLSWTANTEPDLAGYNVYRSLSSPVPTGTPINSSPLINPAFTDSGLINGTAYYYVVTAIDSTNNESSPSNEVNAIPQPYATGLQFDGANDYVTFGPALGLGLPNFTVETWFMRTGPGVATSTGSNGVIAVPLVTKGSPQADGSNLDENYILGIRSSDNVLAGDFEIYEVCNGRPAGDNNPIVGTTPIMNDTWYHAAFTFDGTALKLYLNGTLEATLLSSCLPRYDSIQHAGMATYLTSNGTTSGYFQGVLDETRIWGVARSQSEIMDSINSELVSGTGLVARWGLNEGLGSTIFSSLGTFPGTLINGPQWVTGAPFNIGPPAPPDGSPTSLVANVAPGSQVDLSWTDGSTNETGFNVEVATDPACIDWSSLGATGTNTTAFRHWNTSANTNYCYRVQAYNSLGVSAWSNTATASTPFSYSALSLGKDHAYVRFPSDVLHLQQFTLETWFRREGNGVSNTTGSGGIPQAIPLISKGAAEADGTNQDENFVLVIDDATDVLAADFEECDPADSVDCPVGGTPGLNHPILGSTTIVNNTWYHAAVTYDGTTWKLYLNGILENTLTVGRLPRWDNTAPAGLGTSMTTSGTALGFFNGSLDEVRIWDNARTQADIISTMNSQITAPTTGLVARWSLDEASGTQVGGSAGTFINGSIFPDPGAVGWNWTGDAPFNASLPPNVPTSPVPPDDAVDVNLLFGNSVSLQAFISDPDTSPLTVSFFGRPYCVAPNFTLVALPDTQYYTSQTNSGTRAMFDAQTQWIVDNQQSRNIVYTTHLGDIVDTATDIAQWDIAGKLTDPIGALTRLDNAGLKYGLTIGNHDGAPSATGNFNSYFPITRVGDGHFGSDNDNNYDLFTASGMDFIVIHIEYGADPTVLAWANDLLSIQYPDRRAIVITHNLLSGTTTPAPFTTEGAAIYNALKANPNLFLMLGGHLDTEVSRTDTYNGNTVYSLRSDYQFRTGGNGWLRLMEFQPAADQVQVYTYSPYINQWETDSDSQFTLPYAMGGAGCSPFELVQELQGVSSGTNITAGWTGLSLGTQYEWYVTVSDGFTTVTGPIWMFTTETTPITPISVEISGPQTGLVGTGYPFLATVSPISATLPITYTWEATGQSAVIHTDGFTDTVNFTWENPGVQQITVRADNLESIATDVFTITVFTPVSADFTAAPLSGIAPLDVSFTNLSTGDYATCIWDFGDGETSTDCANSNHLYAIPGVFTVTLTVSGPGGTDTEVKTGYIMIYAPVDAEFTAVPTSGIAPLDVTFTNLSTGDFDTCAWTFGDGGTSNTCSDPLHTYALPGMYTVSLTVSGLGGTNTETKLNYITLYESVVADFSGSPTSGIAPLDVAFTNLSTGDFDTCLWDFGDGGTTSVCSNPDHTYENPGVYTVTLTVSGLGGTSVNTRSGYITVYESVHADFSANPTSGVAPLDVAFTNLSEGDFITCSWDFGDGAISDDCANPYHQYITPGLFTVALTITGPGGSDNATKVDYISVYDSVAADFSGEPTSGIAPLDVSFTNLSVGDFDTCSWDFGDGVILDDCSDSAHQYLLSGAYTVTLTISGLGGADTETKSDYITVYAPVHADFVATPTTGVAPLAVTFTNLSSGDYDTCAWDYGDGGSNSSCSASEYIYANPGTYTVTLTVSGLGGMDILTRNAYIDVQPGTVKIFLPLIINQTAENNPIGRLVDHPQEAAPRAANSRPLWAGSTFALASLVLPVLLFIFSQPYQWRLPFPHADIRDN